MRPTRLCLALVMIVALCPPVWLAAVAANGASLDGAAAANGANLAGADSGFSLADFQKSVTEFTLANGMKFIVVERHGVPVVAFNL